MKLFLSTIAGTAMSQGVKTKCSAAYADAGLSTTCDGEAAGNQECNLFTHVCFTTPDCFERYGCEVDCPGDDFLCSPPVPTPPPTPGPMSKLDCDFNAENFRFDISDFDKLPGKRVPPGRVIDDRKICIVDTETINRATEAVRKEEYLEDIFQNGDSCACEQDGETVYNFGVGFDTLFGPGIGDDEKFVFVGHGWDIKCSLKTVELEDVNSVIILPTPTVGTVTDSDELDFEITARISDKYEINENSLPASEEEFKLGFFFDFETLGGYDKYRPFMQQCNLTFTNSEDTSKTHVVENFIEDGCLSEAVVLDDSFEFTRRDQLQWKTLYYPKAIGGRKAKVNLECRINGCESNDYEGCIYADRCGDSPIVRSLRTNSTDRSPPQSFERDIEFEVSSTSLSASASAALASTSLFSLLFFFQ
ncbi:Oidioi.mRNA.OKI2018_I69.PAR.g12899.t1.cds [Oikopleura dioica]|uniref:Oidioi.mRNA.OKI2018_I69.PAR.g12899.t1.cds n=1 Tax=Oikopleura dioica TaxID=34765 RepID=A0ABN7S2S8_OIKDI|nr:Oidioi.mRNA.OKI2018_I69.PAR.g12899.t1.cds [Oikopleura dioica]